MRCIAKRIHKAPADPRPFQTPYDKASRTTFMQPPEAAATKEPK